MTGAPRKILKRIAGSCLYSGCPDDAADGSDYCGPHDAHERGRDAAKKRRNRQRLADAGLCRDGCGRKVAKQRRADGSVMQRRCSTCKKAHRAHRAGVPGESRGVPGATSATVDPGRITRDVEDDGYARSRYHGQARRGQQKRWQLDLQDIDDAIARLQRARAGILEARDAEQAQAPRVQRDEIRMAAVAQAAHAGRFIGEIRERNGDTDDPSK